MKKELELYVHIPFCVKKCAYCDFLSEPAGEAEKAAYTEALLREIEGSLQRLPYQHGISGRRDSFCIDRGGHRPDFFVSAGKF